MHGSSRAGETLGKHPLLLTRHCNQKAPCGITGSKETLHLLTPLHISTRCALQPGLIWHLTVAELRNSTEEALAHMAVGAAMGEAGGGVAGSMCMPSSSSSSSTSSSRVGSSPNSSQQMPLATSSQTLLLPVLLMQTWLAASSL